jgi:hypothetical protein
MLADLVEQIIGLRAAHEIVGASPEQIAALEQALGVTVPPALRKYFERMGIAAPEFLTGTDTGMTVLADRTRGAAALLEACGLKLDADAIVIASHQGYDVTWVRASLGDASPVFGYREDEPAIEVRFRDVADWLAWAIEEP